MFNTLYCIGLSDSIDAIDTIVWYNPGCRRLRCQRVLICSRSSEALCGSLLGMYLYICHDVGSRTGYGSRGLTGRLIARYNSHIYALNFQTISWIEHSRTSCYDKTSCLIVRDIIFIDAHKSQLD